MQSPHRYILCPLVPFKSIDAGDAAINFITESNENVKLSGIDLRRPSGFSVERFEDVARVRSMTEQPFLLLFLVKTN